MKKIRKWLIDNGIEFTTCEDSHRIVYTIIFEHDCVWMNGLGQEMKYNKQITIHFGKTYKQYTVTEQIGYNRYHKHIECTRADKVINVLSMLLQG